MKDQWSGKTLRAKTLVSVPSDNRSSAQPATAPALYSFLAVAAVPQLVSAVLLESRDISASLPETRPDGFGEVAYCCQVSLVVNGDLELRQRPGGGPEEHAAAVRQVEGRLVARAEQVVGGALVERDRATHVGADLGVADDAVDRPVLAALAGRDVLRLHAEQDHGALGLGDLELDALDEVLAVLVDLEDRGRLGVDQVTDLEVAGLDGRADDVADDAHALGPDRVVERVTGERAQVAQEYHGG